MIIWRPTTYLWLTACLWSQSSLYTWLPNLRSSILSYLTSPSHRQLSWTASSLSHSSAVLACFITYAGISIRSRPYFSRKFCLIRRENKKSTTNSKRHVEGFHLPYASLSQSLCREQSQAMTNSVPMTIFLFQNTSTKIVRRNTKIDSASSSAAWAKGSLIRSVSMKYCLASQSLQHISTPLFFKWCNSHLSSAWPGRLWPSL